MAARIAHYFHLDPVDVLESPMKRYAVRQAAYNYMQRLEKEAQEKAKAEAKAKR